MKTVKELINESAKLLANNGIGSANYSKPKYPTCVIYFGKRSEKYHDELMKDIRRGWGGNTDYIKFYAIEDLGSKAIKNILTDAELSEEDIRTQVTGLLSSQDVFSDMRRVALYCVIDTTDIKDAAEFESWYMMINYINDLFGVATRSMLMLILNQSLNLTKIAQSITGKLADIYSNAEVGGVSRHLYDSVFILSNRLRDGSFKMYDPQVDDGRVQNSVEYKNFNLLGNIILLSNTRNEIEYEVRKQKLYGKEKPAIIASYRYLQKPMKEIVMIALSSILGKLKEMIETCTVDSEMLSKILQISIGRSKLHDDMYASIKENLPGDDFILYLPGNQESFGGFYEVDRASYGCLQMFIDQNHLAIVKDKLSDTREYEYRKIFNMLADGFNAAQLVNGISADVRKTTYNNAEMGLSSAGEMPVLEAITLKVKQMIAEEFRALSDKAISAAITRSKDCMGTFKTLCDEFNNAYSVVEEGTLRNLTTFYVDKFNRYYSDVNKIKNLLVKLLNINNGMNEMLQVLAEELERLFESDPIYKLSYAQELVERLGIAGNEKEIQKSIAHELIDKLESRSCYFTNSTYQEKTMEAYMLNTDDSQDSLTVKYLKERASDGGLVRTFYNTCSNDAAESMWFYVCTVDNLIM